MDIFQDTTETIFLSFCPSFREHMLLTFSKEDLLSKKLLTCVRVYLDYEQNLFTIFFLN